MVETCWSVWSVLGVTFGSIEVILSPYNPLSTSSHWSSHHAGIKTTTEGLPVVNGLQLGNLFIGVQPLLGVEGDPMRMLFERDLTPHPQYVAFYKWIQEAYQADAMVHFGMHGTSEWLPGKHISCSLRMAYALHYLHWCVCVLPSL